MSRGRNDLLSAARDMQATADALNMGVIARPPPPVAADDPLRRYDEFIGDTDLRLATRKLFADGHYANAVEDAFKCVNNAVKRISGSAADGAALMRTAFSPTGPILKLSDLKTQSKKDQQQGYMDILAGCMTGIRNPRAHDSHADDPRFALEMLVWANHLMKMVKSAKRTRKNKTK